MNVLSKEMQGRKVMIRGFVFLLSVLAIGFLAVSPIFAQETIHPTALEQSVLPIEDVDILIMPGIKKSQVLAEDKRRAEEGEPPRFAISMPVSVIPGTPEVVGESASNNNTAKGDRPEVMGTWERIDKTIFIWRLRVTSSGALSLNFGFTRYIMPVGGRLFIYSRDYKRVVGPFTDKDNEEHGQLWTPVVFGDEVILELTLPAAKIDLVELELAFVNHDYRGFGRPQSDKSGSCNVDVICPEGDGWRDQISSVGVYSTGGNRFCSGGLLNNTAQDGTPLFLTANHCTINSSNAASVVVYWNFETSTCGGTPDGQLTDFQSGAIFRAAYADSDMTLIELDDPLNPNHNLYLAGWDRTSTNPYSATAIHHPSCDEKRISLENDPLSTTSYLYYSSPGDGTHFRVADWDTGTTERGSSGSPLFNPDRQLVVGQLHGGDAACGNDLSDWYGKLAVSWSGGGTSTTRLSDWLDPENTGVIRLGGVEHRSIEPGIRITATPNPQILSNPGDVAEFNIQVDSVGGFSGNVTLEVFGDVPPNLDNPLQFTTNPVPTGGSTILTVDTSTSTPKGLYQLTVWGTSGIITSDTLVSLQVGSNLGPVLIIDQVSESDYPSGTVKVSFTPLDPYDKQTTTKDWQFSTDSSNGIDGTWLIIDPAAIGNNSAKISGVKTFITWDTTLGANNLSGIKSNSVFFRMKLDNGGLAMMSLIKDYQFSGRDFQGIAFQPNNSRIWSIDDGGGGEVLEHNSDTSFTIVTSYEFYGSGSKQTQCGEPFGIAWINESNNNPRFCVADRTGGDSSDEGMIFRFVYGFSDEMPPNWEAKWSWIEPRQYADLEFTGLAWDGTTLWSCIIDNQPRILKHVSSDFKQNAADYPAPASDPQGLAWDGATIWSCDGLAKKIYKHNMDNTLSVAEEYGVNFNPSGLAWDGLNIYSSTDGHIYKHNMVSPVSEYSFHGPVTIDNQNSRALPWVYLLLFEEP